MAVMSWCLACLCASDLKMQALEDQPLLKKVIEFRGELDAPGDLDQDLSDTSMLEDPDDTYADDNSFRRRSMQLLLGTSRPVELTYLPGRRQLAVDPDS
mmetsp:Transcript_37890/g.100923  ORF Transcript_37890/g.100923 Transcript_37890/m.100923 type:complete len:99 (-) Transcript_37890:319-615(-)